MDADELIARAEIAELVAAYNHLGDRGQIAEMAELFCEDADLDAFGESYRGREQIEGYYRGLVAGASDRPRRRFVRHHISNVTITVTGPTEGHGASYWLVIGDGGPDSSGRYRDTYRRDPDARWRFATRMIRADPWGANAP
jgi:ketosteroid isomerase-like protein